MDEERRDFLPPEPAGPEPELGQAPPPPPPPQAQPQAPPPGYAPPQGAWQQPPPPGYPPPQAGWQQPPPPPPAWGYAPQPAQPDNGAAVAGFVLSLIAGGLVILSAGLSTVVSIGCAIFGIVYSRKGKKKVDSGETTRNAGLAQAGFIIGIVSLVLAVLATLAWVLILVAAITDEEFRDEIEREFENSESVTAALRIAAAAGRLLLT